jgi:biuret amidohydrolase
MTSALIMLDYQEGLCRTESTLGGPSGLGAQVEQRGVLNAARKSLDGARKNGVRIFHARVGFDPAYARRTNRSPGFDQIEQANLLHEDSADAAICSEVAPVDGEPVIVKGCVDPFVCGPLAAWLVAARVDTVFLGGVATNFVVESAARHAADLGFLVYVVEDMCASYSQELHDFSIQNILPVYGEAIDSAKLEQLASGGR